MPFNEKYLITATALLLVTITGCPDNGKEPDYNIYLTAEDIFCTEVILRVTLPDSGRINTFALHRAEGAAMENETAIDTFTCYDDDTLITDENLLPDRDYTYRVNFLKNGKIKAASEPITIHTMDTTSHNFTWEIDTLGIYGSYLNDVWIVDEDDIWVVGEIIVPDPDSSFDGTGRETFNAAHWNGEEWELMRIVNSAPLLSIFYFSDDDIWANSSYPTHYNGEKWTRYRLDQSVRPGVINACWGTSSSNMYFVGGEGTIVHYDGEHFEKIESGTDVDLKDITGTPDGEYIFISGWNWSGYNNNSPLLRIHEGIVKKIYESTDAGGNTEDWGRIEAIKVIGPFLYITTWGRDLIIYNYKTETIVEEHWRESIPAFKRLLITDLSSVGYNNTIAASWLGDVVHFNGVNWKRLLNSPGNYITVRGCAFNGNMVVIVGYVYLPSQGSSVGFIMKGNHLN